MCVHGVVMSVCVVHCASSWSAYPRLSVRARRGYVSVCARAWSTVLPVGVLAQDRVSVLLAGEVHGPDIVSAKLYER